MKIVLGRLSKPQLFYFLAALVVVSILLLISLLPPRRSEVRPVHTINLLKIVYRTISILEERNSASIGSQLMKVSGNSSLHQKWEQLLVNEILDEQFDREYIQRVLCSDAYGNRFNVELKENLMAAKGVEKLLSTPFDVVIWSSGPNGSNELGKGDDIVFQASEARKSESE